MYVSAQVEPRHSRRLLTLYEVTCRHYLSTLAVYIFLQRLTMMTGDGGLVDSVGACLTSSPHWWREITVPLLTFGCIPWTLDKHHKLTVSVEYAHESLLMSMPVACYTTCPCLTDPTTRHYHVDSRKQAALACPLWACGYSSTGWRR